MIKMVRRVTFAGILVNVAIAAAKAVAGVMCSSQALVREGQTLLYKLHCICLILRNSIMVKCKKMK